MSGAVPLLPTYVFMAWTGTIPFCISYEGWNFNSGNYLFTTDTK